MSDNNEDNRQQETAEEQPVVQETAEEQPVTVEAVEEKPAEQETAEEQPAEQGSEETVTSPDGNELTVVESQEVVVAGEPEHKPKELHMGNMIDAIKAMISFFTIIPLSVGEKECNAMERNFWLAPALGAINGFVVFLVVLVLGLCLDTNTALLALIAMATVFIFSKFLHFDGLVDFGDGMIVSSDKQEDHVRALKDSLIGAGGYGVSLIVILLSLYCMSSLSWDVMAQVDNTWTKFITVAFIVWPLEILIKNAQVAAAAFGKPGNGMAANQVGNTELNDVLLSTVLTTVLVIITSLISWGIGSLCPFNTELPLAVVILLMLVAILMSVGVGYLMAYVSNKTFGFVNGDVLGATNEISRAAILLITLILLTVSLW